MTGTDRFSGKNKRPAVFELRVFFMGGVVEKAIYHNGHNENKKLLEFGFYQQHWAAEMRRKH